MSIVCQDIDMQQIPPNFPGASDPDNQCLTQLHWFRAGEVEDIARARGKAEIQPGKGQGYRCGPYVCD